MEQDLIEKERVLTELSAALVDSNPVHSNRKVHELSVSESTDETKVVSFFFNYFVVIHIIFHYDFIH